MFKIFRSLTVCLLTWVVSLASDLGRISGSGVRAAVFQDFCILEPSASWDICRHFAASR